MFECLITREWNCLNGCGSDVLYSGEHGIVAGSMSSGVDFELQNPMPGPVNPSHLSLIMDQDIAANNFLSHMSATMTPP